MIKNIIGHTKTVIKHKWIVFKLACRAGIPWRGFVHDLSKFSPTEFGESVKYYVGVHSPITEAKKDKGYSEAWLHHKGRNKHHWEYWYDTEADESKPIMPYKYTVEMICDKLAASITYGGKEWNNSSELKYWNEKERERSYMNKNLKRVLDEVFLQISEEGINKTINKRNLRMIYNKYCK